MKKLFLSFAILLAASTVLVSCGDDKKDGSGNATPAANSSANKSTCDCMKLVAENPSADKAPAGCEWMEKTSEEESKKLMDQAMKDCPETMKAMGMGGMDDEGMGMDDEGMGMGDEGMEMGGDMMADPNLK